VFICPTKIQHFHDTIKSSKSLKEWEEKTKEIKYVFCEKTKEIKYVFCIYILYAVTDFIRPENIIMKHCVF
jgi:hypothetical protein